MGLRCVGRKIKAEGNEGRGGQRKLLRGRIYGEKRRGGSVGGWFWRRGEEDGERWLMREKEKPPVGLWLCLGRD